MSNWYTPSILPEQLFQARLKAHDAIQEHLKQLITVSGATLALTVTFLKDVVQTPSVAGHRPLLFIGWALLIACIAVAVIAISVLVNSLDRVNAGRGRDGYPVAFAAGFLPLPRLLVLTAFGCFVWGLAFLALFAWINFPRQDQSSATTVEWRPRFIGSITHFRTGSAELSSITGYDVSKRLDDICSVWKRQKTNSSCPSVVVVGNADRQQLQGDLLRQYGSNAGLARARAEVVKDRLLSCSADCAVAEGDRALVLVTGPSITPLSPLTGGGDDLAKDRSVDVWTLPLPALMAETPTGDGRKSH